MDKINRDLLSIIISFLGKDICSISKLSECNKHLLKLCRENWVWEDYYRSLFKEKHIITNSSTHLGTVNYYYCRIGIYPGWNHVHDEINNIPCNNPNHYINTKIVKKNIKWKNLFKMCAKRQLTIDKKKYKWSYADQYMLDKYKEQFYELKRKIKYLEKRKNNNEKLDDRYTFLK